MSDVRAWSITLPTFLAACLEFAVLLKMNLFMRLLVTVTVWL